MKTTDQPEAMKIDIPNSEQFKKWRNDLGWSRKEAATMLQYSHASAISQIETGFRKVPSRVALMMQMYDLTHKPFKNS